METHINRIIELSNEHEQILNKMSESAHTDVPLNLLKREAIRIEGLISSSIENLRFAIHNDDRISTEHREAKLISLLKENGIDLEQMKIRRRVIINEVNQAMTEIRLKEQKENREKLLGKDSKAEVKKILETKNKGAIALATETTSKLERTRELIRMQVQESQNSIELLKESTEQLNSINESLNNVENKQRKASLALIRLRVAQNWDRYLLNFSRIVFALAVIYVVYSNLTHNLIIDFAKIIYRKIKNRQIKTHEIITNITNKTNTTQV